MASIQKVGKRWRVRVRRQGFPCVSEMFGTKAQAQAWATKTESDMQSLKYQDGRIIADKTLGALIDDYVEEFGAFGKNKTAVLNSLKCSLGDVLLPHLNGDRLIKYVKTRLAGVNGFPAAGGVTIGIDLTYLAGMLRAAKEVWRLPVDIEAVARARNYLKHIGVSTKSNERTRRPTKGEIEDLCTHFRKKPPQRIPMWDLIPFAVGTAMRLSEIINLKWSDLNKEHRTIIIRDRKHPRAKKGNDQEVPLLGDTYKIIERQPRLEDEKRIFPVTEGTVSSIFPRACNRLKIIDLHFHDLRHEGVSRLFEQGYTIEQVALVSGHRDWKMLARYTQIRAKDLHRAILQT